MKELLARMELELVVVTDGVVWVELSLKLLTITDVVVDTAAASKEVAGLRCNSCSSCALTCTCK